jgi:hypothetical protein
LYSFQHTIQQALGDVDTQNTADSMKQLAKLRDIAPKLIEMSSIDIGAITSRIELAEQKAESLVASAQKDRSVIAELKERVRELEEGKSAVGDLEVLVRQMQSQINTLPAALPQKYVFALPFRYRTYFDIFAAMRLRILEPSAFILSSAALPSIARPQLPLRNHRPSQDFLSHPKRTLTL